jgi:hypothetical protein
VSVLCGEEERPAVGGGDVAGSSRREAKMLRVVDGRIRPVEAHPRLARLVVHGHELAALDLDVVVAIELAEC